MSVVRVFVFRCITIGSGTFTLGNVTTGKEIGWPTFSRRVREQQNADGRTDIAPCHDVIGPLVVLSVTSELLFKVSFSSSGCLRSYMCKLVAGLCPNYC